MPRRKRIIVPDCPHHITQRGVRKQDVFLEEKDRRIYLRLLRENAARYKVEVIAYCLMTNHVHHLLVPKHEDSLSKTLQYTHKRYAEYFNAKNGWTGHAWQEKFYSSPVDEEYFWVALKYIEQNPLKAGMVDHPADHPWSSASAHCNITSDELLTRDAKWVNMKAQISDWKSWLLDEGDSKKIDCLRRNTFQDLPSGAEQFLDDLEEKTGLPARKPKLGRPRKVEK